MNAEGTNMAKATISGVTAVAGGAASWVEHIETGIRLAGSLVALIGGILTIWFIVVDRLEKRRKKKHEKNKHSNHHGS